MVRGGSREPGVVRFFRSGTLYAGCVLLALWIAGLAFDSGVLIREQKKRLLGAAFFSRPVTTFFKNLHRVG